MNSDSQSNNKRIARNTVMLYIRMFFTMAIALYASRVVLAILGAVDYGIYNVVGGFVTMFSMISGAMTTATQRFISFEIGKGEEGNVKTMFSTAVIIHIVLALIILLLAETLGLWFVNTQMNFPEERYTAVNWVYQFSVATFIVNVICVPYNAAIVAYEKMTAFAYVSIIDAVLKLLILYLLCLSSIDSLILYSALLAMVTITISLIYGGYCTIKFSECRCNWQMSPHNRNKMLSFVSWNLIGSLAGVLREQGVNVLLNIFFGAAVNAARGIAYQVLGAVKGFVSNFQLAMNPQIVKSYAAEEKENMYNIVFRGSRFSFLLVLTMALPIIIEAPIILQLWLKDVPDYTVVFLRLVLITAIISSLSGTLITAMHASGKVRDYQIVVGSISLMTLPFAYILLKLGLEPQYALVAGLIIEFIDLFARMYMLKRSIDFPVKSFIRNVLLKVLPVVLISPLLPVYMSVSLDNGIISFLIICIISVLATLIFSFWLGITSNERQFFLNKVIILVNRVKKND